MHAKKVNEDLGFVHFLITPLLSYRLNLKNLEEAYRVALFIHDTFRVLILHKWVMHHTLTYLTTLYKFLLQHAQ